MLYELSLFVIVFFVYSFIGYILEVISVSKIEKRLVLSRGYLVGPYLPIFGFGSIIMIGFLDKYSNDLVALFVLSMVMCSLLEYFTSLLLDLLFHLRWWDYSDRKYNINGRVCLENSVLFGLCGIIVVKWFNPLLISFISSFNYLLVIVFGIIIFSIMFIDFIFSTSVIVGLKLSSNRFTDKDSTDRVKSEILNSLSKYKILHKRLYKAFPTLKNNHNIKELLKGFQDRRDKFKSRKRKG